MILAAKHLGLLVWGVPWVLPALWAGWLQHSAPLPPVRVLNRYAYLALVGLGLSGLFMVWLAPSIRPVPDSQFTSAARPGYIVEAWFFAVAFWASTRSWLAEANASRLRKAERHPEFVDTGVLLDPNKTAVRVAALMGIAITLLGVLAL